MGRPYIQLVMGPAGSGKSTFCYSMQQHCQILSSTAGAGVPSIRKRNVHVINLDPAAEIFNYDVSYDIKDLITVQDVMEELGLGPNGSLIYCMEYLLENMDWLEDCIDSFDDDEYVLIDCPGQIELYTHVPIMSKVISSMKMWGLESKIASVFLVDATFVCDASKFISGSLLSLSAMIALELPHVNVLSKCDLVDENKVNNILDTESAMELWDREEYNIKIEEEAIVSHLNQDERTKRELRRKKLYRLTEAICSLIDDYSMVSFIPLNAKDEDSIDFVLSHIDHVIQYGEDLEVRGAEHDDEIGFNNRDDNMS